MDITIKKYDKKYNELIRNFDCGNVSINEYIKTNAEYDDDIEKTRTKLIFSNNKIVGFFTLALSEIELFDEITDTDHYYALSIEFITVNKKYQKNGIGKSILLYIIDDVISILREYIPCRYIVLNALRNKKSWYLKNGFEELEDDDKESKTVRMYMNLINVYELEQKYESECD